MGMLKGAHQPVVLVLTAAVAVLVLAAAGAAQSEFTAAATLQIAIHETGSENHPNSHTIGGVKFTVESLSAGVHLANIGSGAALIFPNKGVPKVVDGEQQAPVTGSQRLTSKNGELLFSFSGTSITVNGKLLPSGEFRGFDNERGTWKIDHGTGIYKGWKGGGRWAGNTDGTINSEWDGRVTH